METNKIIHLRIIFFLFFFFKNNIAYDQYGIFKEKFFLFIADISLYSPIQSLAQFFVSVIDKRIVELRVLSKNIGGRIDIKGSDVTCSRLTGM